jgi:cyclic pyranopterin phosphate synthase
MSRLTHLDEKGAARMVDVGTKEVTARQATAKGRVLMKPETLVMIEAGSAKKGDVLASARIAGIMAAKKTHELIPLCHPLMISSIAVEFTLDRNESAIDVAATVKIDSKTGVEMEALTAVAVACLTLYDMCKSADRAMRITDIHLVEKKGGKSGHYVSR